MSIYSCRISNVSRAKGSSSCATLAYITGQTVEEERTGQAYSYGRADRVEAVGTLLPDNAPEAFKDAKTLFNSIENFEKSENARTAKKVIVALPREFDTELQKSVVENYIKDSITAKGYACTYAIHTDKDNHNPHVHILIANRQINNKGEWGSKRKSVYVLDENGNKIPQLNKDGTQKVRYREGKGEEKLWVRKSVEVNPLDTKEMLKELRKQWAVECNKHLQREKQIDHRSYEERGIERIPTIHEGYVARKIEKEGGVSEVCEKNRTIKALNNKLIQLGRELVTLAKEKGRLVAEMAKETKEKLNDELKQILGRDRHSSGSRSDSKEQGTPERERQPEGKAGRNGNDFLRELLAQERASEKKRSNSVAERADREAERERLAAEKSREVESRERANAERIKAVETRERELGPKL